MPKPKILVFDIETAPALGDVWGLWQNNVGLSQLRKSGFIMSWSAKWLGEKKVYYADCSKNGEADEMDMLLKLVDLLDQADMIIAHNGDRFDMGWVRGRMLYYGIPPFGPVKQIDTLKVAKRHFRLISNKLEYIAKLLGCDEKLKHKNFAGHELWAECIKGNKKAWKEMKTYNKQDVVTLEQVYYKLRPFMTNHPNVGLYGVGKQIACPLCGSNHVHKRGFAYTGVSVFQRYRCNDCGGWSRKAINLVPKERRKNILRNVI